MSEIYVKTDGTFSERFEVLKQLISKYFSLKPSPVLKNLNIKNYYWQEHDKVVLPKNASLFKILGKRTEATLKAEGKYKADKKIYKSLHKHIKKVYRKKILNQILNLI